MDLGDAYTLSLGEYTDAECLNNSQVAILLEEVHEEEGDESNDVFNKFFDYVKKFNKYKRPTVVEEVDRLLDRYDIHSYEKALLANLCPETIEEARTLIPSLRDRIDDDTLESILRSLRNSQLFVGQ